jgi:hypothetical protein
VAAGPLAKGRLRAKLDDLQMACGDRFTAGHAQMRRLHACDRLTAEIATLDQLAAQAAAPFEAVVRGYYVLSSGRDVPTADSRTRCAVPGQDKTTPQ